MPILEGFHCGSKLDLYITSSVLLGLFVFVCIVCYRWENLDKNVAMPDDDLSESPPYMELSDDEHEAGDSNYCPPQESRASFVCGRSLSNPFPDGSGRVGSHSGDSGGGMESRHKSPSDGNVGATLSLCAATAAGLVEEMSRGHDRDNGRDEEETDRDAIVNGGTVYTTLYVVKLCVHCVLVDFLCFG